VIAWILTALQRRLLGPCPLFGFSAPVPRTGKSLLSEAIAIIATGKPAPASAVSNDFEELRKSFTAALKEGQMSRHVWPNFTSTESSCSGCRSMTPFKFTASRGGHKNYR
jgi:hypothetical protein